MINIFKNVFSHKDQVIEKQTNEIKKNQKKCPKIVNKEDDCKESD